MKKLIELFNIFPVIEGSSFVLRELRLSDFDDLKRIFDDVDTKKYYHLLPEHQQDLGLFITSLFNNYKNHSQITWVISPRTDVETAIGFVSIEFENDEYLINAKLSYALNVKHRKSGIITESVHKVVTLLEDYPLAQVIAFVELDNIPSVKVMENNGFTTNSTIAFIDQNIEDGAFRYKWGKDIMGSRIYLFNIASQYYQNKDYNKSIEIFQSALEQDYIEDTPHTDLQIYSNIGMALTSQKRYSEAYKCLLYVQENGLSNPSITRELSWLKTNVPHLL